MLAHDTHEAEPQDGGDPITEATRAEARDAPILIDVAAVAEKVAKADRETAAVSAQIHNPPDSNNNEEWLNHAFALAGFPEPLTVGMMLRTRPASTTTQSQRLCIQWAQPEPDQTRICQIPANTEFGPLREFHLCTVRVIKLNPANRQMMLDAKG